MCDVSNEYVIGELDVPIITKQPTDSFRVMLYLGKICLLYCSCYRARQVGRIWGGLLHDRLQEWGFEQLKINNSLYFFHKKDSFAVLAVIFDDILLASDPPALMVAFKQRMTFSFDVKLQGKLESFIYWSVIRPSLGSAYSKTSSQSVSCRD